MKLYPDIYVQKGAEVRWRICVRIIVALITSLPCRRLPRRLHPLRRRCRRPHLRLRQPRDAVPRLGRPRRAAGRILPRRLRRRRRHRRRRPPAHDPCRLLLVHVRSWSWPVPSSTLRLCSCGAPTRRAARSVIITSQPPIDTTSAARWPLWLLDRAMDRGLPPTAARGVGRPGRLWRNLFAKSYVTCSTNRLHVSESRHDGPCVLSGSHG